MIKPSGNQTVSVGESVTLECVAEGNPDARVVWVPPPRSALAEVEGRGSAIIRLDPVTENDAGTFTCYIYTDYGQEESSIVIIGK